MRSELLRGFEAIRVEGQGGSRPRAPMQAAMSQVRGFLTELHAKHRSGGVVFVDGQTAFYATVRQGLLGRDADATLPYLGYLASVLLDEETERDRFVATALAPGLLERCDVQRGIAWDHTVRAPLLPIRAPRPGLLLPILLFNMSLPRSLPGFRLGCLR